MARSSHPMTMITATTRNAKEEFEAEGYLTPLVIMSPEEMGPYREEFNRLESITGKQASQVGLMNVHKHNPRIWELVSHPRVLAAVSEVLGPDLLLLGSHFFCKHPNVADSLRESESRSRSKQPTLADSYVSWHQDVTYWGLNPPKAVTLWLSVDGADVENGCMRVIPRSHLGGLLPHGKAQTQGNLLSVNQEIDLSLVDESSAVDIELPPGSASLHHGMTIHGSNPNRSIRRRCGLTMRFTTPEVAPTGEPDIVEWKPILMQGEDRFGRFALDPWPAFAQATRAVRPLVRSFSDAEPYEQDEPGESCFHWLLKKDEIPELQIGLVELAGPIHKTPASHEEFHQVYLIQSGQGTIHLGDQQRYVDGPTVVVIPKGTRHSVELAGGQVLRYVFVNQYRV